MKKLFKLFPLALAALTFASCSDDLTIANGEKELDYSPDKLLVQIEGDGSSDVTRGGYVTNIYNYNLYSALAFDAGETLKLYHDATSWRPEIWTSDGYGQYKNATGIATFKKAGSTITADENAYGIYPSTASVFGNEDRTSIQYDLSDLAFVNYGVDGEKTYAGTTGEGAITKYYQAEFPLWGVKAAGAQVMTMKHLAGILRLDIASVGAMPAATVPPADPQYKYIIIYSATKKLTGKINTAADLLNPTLLEELDPTKFMSETPALEVEATANTAALNAIPLTEVGAEAVDNVIVMRIDASTEDDHVMAFVPILPEMAGGDVHIYVTPVLTTNPATIDLTNAANIQYDYPLTAAIIKECNDAYQGGGSIYAGKNTVQRGVTYKINDDSTNKNETAKTPFQLAEGIIAADKKAYRDFEVTFTQPIEVKNNDDSPQNFWMNIAGGDDRYGLAEGWELKHNVTVHLTLKESDDAGTVPSVLYIKTKGGKKLTLDITNDAKKVDSIVVVKDGLKNELVLKEATGAAKLSPIHIKEGNNDKVTLVSGTTSLKTNSSMTIKTNQNAGDNVDALILAKGVDKVSIIGGRISGVYLDAAEPIAADATIYTEGKVGINEVYYNNMPKDGAGTVASPYNDKYNLKFESKWTGENTTVFPEATITDGTTPIAHSILTAAQLSAAAVAGQDYTVVGKYDLDGTKCNWTPLAGLTKSVKGAQYFRYSNANTRAITGVATIENLKSNANGLLATWNPAADNDEISNFTFGGTNKVEVTAGTKLGLLVGDVTTANAGIIKNITLGGTNNIQNTIVGKNAACVAIGGVIGKTSGAAALQLANVQVGSGTSVYGFKNVGGIIGEIGGKVIFGAQKADGTNKFAVDGSANVEDGDVFNTSAATLTTILVATAPASPNLPAKGQFFGGASAIANPGDITILAKNGLSKLSTPRESDIANVDWGYYLPDVNTEYWKWKAYLNYNEIGHCGYEVAGNVVQVVAAFKDIYVLKSNGAATPKYATTMKLRPNVGTTIPVDAAVGTPDVYYFGYVIKPY